MILGNMQELARFLLDKSEHMDCVEPCPSLQRSDTKELRRRILDLTQRESKELGMGKSTLHYLRRKAMNDRRFKVYHKVTKRLVQ